MLNIEFARLYHEEKIKDYFRENANLSIEQLDRIEQNRVRVGYKAWAALVLFCAVAIGVVLAVVQQQGN